MNININKQHDPSEVAGCPVSPDGLVVAVAAVAGASGCLELRGRDCP